MTDKTPQQSEFERATAEAALATLRPKVSEAEVREVLGRWQSFDSGGPNSSIEEMHLQAATSALLARLNPTDNPNGEK